MDILHTFRDDQIELRRQMIDLPDELRVDHLTRELSFTEKQASKHCEVSNVEVNRAKGDIALARENHYRENLAKAQAKKISKYIEKGNDEIQEDAFDEDGDVPLNEHEQKAVRMLADDKNLTLAEAEKKYREETIENEELEDGSSAKKLRITRAETWQEKMDYERKIYSK